MCVCATRSLVLFIDSKLWVSNWFNRKSKTIHKPHMSCVLYSPLSLSLPQSQLIVDHGYGTQGIETIIKATDTHWLTLHCLALSVVRSVVNYRLLDFTSIAYEISAFFLRNISTVIDGRLHLTPLLFAFVYMSTFSLSNIYDLPNLVHSIGRIPSTHLHLFFILNLYGINSVVCWRSFCCCCSAGSVWDFI